MLFYAWICFPIIKLLVPSMRAPGWFTNQNSMKNSWLMTTLLFLGKWDWMYGWYENKCFDCYRFITYRENDRVESQYGKDIYMNKHYINSSERKDNMKDRIKKLKQYIRDGKHKKHRLDIKLDILEECINGGLSSVQRAAHLTRRMCETEQPVILTDEKIVFTRTIPSIPSVYSSEEWAQLSTNRTLHELGTISNICGDWGMVLTQGLLGRKKAALTAREINKEDHQVIEFLDCAIETIDAVLTLSTKYANKARRMNRYDLAEILEHVPANPPRSFHEALQGLRLLHAVVWLGGHYHVGLGRFDQYMWPYLKADLNSGRLDIEGAEEILAEFFISLNKDSDFYPGVQQGDNGQTLMVGGVTPEGIDGCNELTRMVLRVACDVAMIDPKINLRFSGQRIYPQSGYAGADIRLSGMPTVTAQQLER
ncbi:hypothetical protein GF407_13455 [candidate division KSB1 bacterium]|nr:hypothetical protein [candidate division KSB1 bacterium]